MLSDATPSAPAQYVVIFTTLLRPDHPEYEQAAQRMVERVQSQRGFAGFESVRDQAGMGITVSYWRDLEAIAAWRQDSEHSSIRQQGRDAWYQHFHLVVAKIERELRWERRP